MQRLEERGPNRIERLNAGIRGARSLAHDVRINRRLNRDPKYHLGNKRTETAMNRHAEEWHPLKFSEDLYHSFQDRPLTRTRLRLLL